MKESIYLLASPANAERLFRALHGDCSKDRLFEDVEALRSELGLARKSRIPRMSKALGRGKPSTRKA